MKLNLGSGVVCLGGFENLDVRWGWKFESLLPYAAGSVQGITISHALMYLAEHEWPRVFADFHRALAPGGVIRITEDDTESETSKRKRYPHPDALLRTGPKMAALYLNRAGFRVHGVGRDETHFSDSSLIQAWRNEEPPYYFFIEGVKPERQSVPEEITRLRPPAPDIRASWMWARRKKIAALRTVYLRVHAMAKLQAFAKPE